MRNGSQIALKDQTTLAPLTPSSHMAKVQLVLCIPSTTAVQRNNMAQAIPAKAASQEENANGKDHRWRLEQVRTTGHPHRISKQRIVPASADQIGQSVAFKKDQVDAGRGYDGAKLGNELATNVGKGGPGTGRTLYGHCGTRPTRPRRRSAEASGPRHPQ